MGYDYQSSPQQSAVMQLLLAAHPALLSRDEVRREIDSRIDADDALAQFVRVGLVHRIRADGGAEFFLATRTAMAADEACTAHILASRES